MYWSRNKPDVDSLTWETDDGFRRWGLWKGYDTGQNIFFLHGGLHIFEDDDGVRKHSYDQSEGGIIEQVRSNLSRNKFPLFVSEPTSQKKMRKIDASQYLSYCFRALRYIGGTIFIYGHSLDENDAHIFKNINLSYAKKSSLAFMGIKQLTQIKEFGQMRLRISIMESEKWSFLMRVQLGFGNRFQESVSFAVNGAHQNKV